jgi:hypothetical protein
MYVQGVPKHMGFIFPFFAATIAPAENFFFSVGNQKKLFHNFNTATHGGLKNQIFEKKI